MAGFCTNPFDAFSCANALQTPNLVQMPLKLPRRRRYDALPPRRIGRTAVSEIRLTRWHRKRAQALARAVDELPLVTRQAMLVAVEADELIVGAYTDRRGRMCPMLAAHRLGARTDVGSFPRAWDAFGGARRPRPATCRELEILKALLEETLECPMHDWSQEATANRPEAGQAVGSSTA
jgi:hypothetical protein